MKTTFLYIQFFLFIFLFSNAQEKFEIKTEKYYSNIFSKEEKTYLIVERVSDSIHIELSTTSHFFDFLKKYFDKNNTKQILLSLNKSQNSITINQIVYLNSNGKIVIHKGSKQVYGSVSDFTFEEINCINFKDGFLNFPIFNKKDNP